MTTEAINNNLNILVDPTFAHVNRLFHAIMLLMQLCSIICN